MTKMKIETSAEMFARAEKLKRSAELNPLNTIAAEAYPKVLARAQETLTTELKEKGKKFYARLLAGIGEDWYELIKTQYPVSEVSGKFVVTSEARDWDKSWEFDCKWLAYEKVSKLVGWLDEGRDRGYGSREADIARLTKEA